MSEEGKALWRGRFGLAVGVVAFACCVIAYVAVTRMESELGRALISNSYLLIGAALGIDAWERVKRGSDDG